jgi:hypothetical protein
MAWYLLQGEDYNMWGESAISARLSAISNLYQVSSPEIRLQEILAVSNISNPMADFGYARRLFGLGRL